MFASFNYIHTKYGGYKNCLHHIKSELARRFGVYEQIGMVDWRKVKRLVFICKGNVCRSPYAATKVAQMGFLSSSFGLDTGGNTPANFMAVQCAHTRGVDLSRHLSTQIQKGEFGAADLLLFFEPGHILKAKQMIEASESQMTLVGLWSSPKRPYIFDPYGRSLETFSNCFDIIDSAMTSIVAHLRQG